MKKLRLVSQCNQKLRNQLSRYNVLSVSLNFTIVGDQPTNDVINCSYEVGTVRAVFSVAPSLTSSSVVVLLSADPL